MAYVFITPDDNKQVLEIAIHHRECARQRIRGKYPTISDEHLEHALSRWCFLRRVESDLRLATVANAVAEWMLAAGDINPAECDRTAREAYGALEAIRPERTTLQELEAEIHKAKEIESIHPGIVEFCEQGARFPEKEILEGAER